MRCVREGAPEAADEHRLSGGAPLSISLGVMAGEGHTSGRHGRLAYVLLFAVLNVLRIQLDINCAILTWCRPCPLRGASTALPALVADRAYSIGSVEKGVAMGAFENGMNLDEQANSNELHLSISLFRTADFSVSSLCLPNQSCLLLPPQPYIYG